jgi:hypothetical protein
MAQDDASWGRGFSSLSSIYEVGTPSVSGVHETRGSGSYDFAVRWTVEAGALNSPRLRRAGDGRSAPRRASRRAPAHS